MPDWRKLLLGDKPFRELLIIPLVSGALFHYGVVLGFSHLFLAGD